MAPYFRDPDRAPDLTPFRVTGRTQDEVWRSLGDDDLTYLAAQANAQCEPQWSTKLFAGPYSTGSSTVFALHSSSSGGAPRLYFGGNFSSVTAPSGGVSGTQGVAVWDGNLVKPLGTGVAQRADDLVVGRAGRRHVRAEGKLVADEVLEHRGDTVAP